MLALSDVLTLLKPHPTSKSTNRLSGNCLKGRISVPYKGQPRILLLRVAKGLRKGFQFLAARARDFGVPSV